MASLTLQMMELLAGALFLLIAVVGGGFTAKELTIPRVPLWGRCAAAAVGIVLLGVGIFLPTLQSGLAPPTQACRSPRNLPNVVTVVRSEADARNLLTADGFFNIISELVFVPGAPHGVVVGQSPAPGKILCPRDQVTIKVTA